MSEIGVPACAVSVLGVNDASGAGAEPTVMVRLTLFSVPFLSTAVSVTVCWPEDVKVSVGRVAMRLLAPAPAAVHLSVCAPSEQVAEKAAGTPALTPSAGTLMTSEERSVDAFMSGCVLLTFVAFESCRMPWFLPRALRYFVSPFSVIMSPLK